MERLSLRQGVAAGFLGLSFLLASVSAYSTDGAIVSNFDIPPGMAAEFVEIADDVSIIDFSGDFNRSSEDGSYNAAARAVIAQEFFENHADDYDFLFFFSLFDYDMGGAAAFHVGAQNVVEGIGMPIFDNTASYGSDKRLLGTIDMGPALLDAQRSDPINPLHEQLITTTMHEMLHQWGVFVDFVDSETGQVSSALRGADGAHWSALVNSNASVEYGAKWLDNGDGTFTAVSERVFYSPMDLYLMGMAAPEEVPPFFIIEDSDPIVDPTDISVIGRTVAGRRKDITIADIVAAEGPRSPSWQDAKTSFNSAFVIVKRPGQDVPSEVFGRINTLRKTAAQRFSILTGGRGIMHVHSRVKPVASVGEVEETLSDAGERVGEFKRDDALTWLRSAQLTEGNWLDKPATALRDSLLVDNVLLDFDPLYSSVARASFQQWLSSISFDDNDARSRIASSQLMSVAAVRDKLVAAQNADGGWGITAEHTSSPLDTALVLQSLLAGAYDPNVVSRSVDYLRVSQNGDGGWGVASGAASEVGSTAEALKAVAAISFAQDMKQAAAVWLAGQQQSDGSFGGDQHRIVATAQALWALADAGALENIDTSAAVTYMQQRQGANGSWDNSVFNTALVLKSVGRVQFGNWTVSSIAANQTSVADGEYLGITATIKNDGNLPAQSTTAALYLGDPANGGVLIDSLTLPAIGIGQSVDVVFDWDSFGSAGTQDLYVVIDPDNITEERTELDNTQSVSVEVVPPVEGIDLLVNAIDVVPTQVSSLPTDIGLSAVLRNAGSSEAESVVVQWWGGAVGAETLLHSETVQVPARGNVLLTTNYLWQSSGDRTFTLIVDPDNVIPETNDNNNRRTITKSLSASLDLAVAASDIQILNTPAFGQTLDARVTLHNYGTQPSPAFHASVVIEGEGNQIPLENFQLSLDPGESRTFDLPWQVDALGNFELVVRIDPEQAIAELSEANNEARQAFIAQVIDGSNLKVTHENLIVSPRPLLEGYGATLDAEVVNTGNIAASNVLVRFYDGKPDGGGVMVAEVVLPQIEPATSATATGVWQQVDGNADRVIYVVVDPDNAVSEFDETDNQSFVQASVHSLPDLAIDDASVVLNPPLLAAGEALSAEITIANLGIQDATQASVSVYWDSENAQGLINEQLIDVAGNTEHKIIVETVAPSLGEHALIVVLDGSDSIAERQENNNRVSALVAVQNGDFYLDNPYISPNGDGEKDAVTLVYRVDVGGGGYLTVSSAQGELVRTLPTDGAVNSTITWDGRNELGGIVGDGAYSLTLRSSSGTALATATVVVDNNREPLTRALLEGDRALISDLTCNLPNDPVRDTQWRLSSDELSIFFDKNNGIENPGAEAGLFRAAVGASTGTAVALRDSFPDATEIKLLARSKSGDRLVFSVDRENIGGTQNRAREIYQSDRLGGATPQLLMAIDSETYSWWNLPAAEYGKDDQTIFLAILNNSGQPDIFNANTGAVIQSVNVPPNLPPNDYQVQIAPNYDHSGLLVTFFGSHEAASASFLVDTINKKVTFADSTAELDYLSSFYGDGRSFDSFFCVEGNECLDSSRRYGPLSPVWSADGRRYAITGNDQTLRIKNIAGDVVSEHTLPKIASPLYELTSIQWSSDGDSLAFYYGGAFLCDDCSPYTGGYIYKLDLLTGELTPLLPYHTGNNLLSFHFSIWNGEEWVERAQTHHARRLDEHVADLQKYLPDAEGRYRVRVTQVGREEGFADQISMLSKGGRQLPPASVTLVGENRDVTDSFLRRDYAMVDLHNKTVDVEWSAETGLSGRVALFAQESSPTELKVKPFDYPVSVNESYKVPLSKGRSWTLDGLPESDGLSELFSVWSQPDTAHRAAEVRGYAGSDQQFLYAALDFAVDSTEENRGDWAALEVNTPTGWRTFTVDAERSQWGEVAFTGTPGAKWPHRYYEFKVPIQELGLAPGGVAQIRFKAYGSAGLITNNFKLSSTAPFIWLPSDDALMVYDESELGRGYIVRFSPDIQVDPVLASIGYTDLALSPQRRKLIYSGLPPEGACNLTRKDESITQLYSFDTLDNLTVDMRLLRSSKAPGISIFGTVADKHLDRFTLMYSRNGVDNWSPVRPAGNRAYTDELITSWVPPEEGRYFVRLTGYDEAGNSLSVMKQVVWSDQTPITDIYLDNDLISPNSDGRNDQVGLHFRVRAPVNLSVQVFNGDSLIRTFENGYDVIGEEAWVYWDGRDQNGRLVPDGVYRIVIMGIEYIVEIDNTYPDLTFRITENPLDYACVGLASAEVFGVAQHSFPYSRGGRNACTFSYNGSADFLYVRFSWFADVNDEPDLYNDIRVEYSPVGSEIWMPLFEPGTWYSSRLNEVQVSTLKFRASVTDLAGNESIVEFQPTALRSLANIVRAGAYQPSAATALGLGQSFAYFGEPVPVHLDRSKTPYRLKKPYKFGDIRNVNAPTHFTLSETVADDIIGVYAEYRGIGDELWLRDSVEIFLVSNWQECASTIYKIDDKTRQRVEPDCDDILETGDIEDGRIHLVWDMAKLPVASARNELRFVLVSANGEETVTPEVTVSPLTFSVGEFDTPIFAESSSLVLHGDVFALEEMEKLEVYLTGEDDPRFREESLLGSISPSGLFLASSGYVFELDASELLACTEYSVRAVMTLRNGVTWTKTTPRSTPCMKPLYRVEYPQALGEASDIVTVHVWPVTLGSVPLKSIEVYAPLSGGGKDVLATYNDPQDLEVHSFELDTAGWPSGVTRLAIRLVDELENDVVEQVSVYRDTQPPVLELPAPLAGQRICGKQPLQISYADTNGGIGEGQQSEGWQYSDEIYPYIDQGDDGGDLGQSAMLDGFARSPRANARALRAFGRELFGLNRFSEKLFKGSLSDEPFVQADTFAELLVEAIAQDGTVLQSFPLWDSGVMPREQYPDLHGPSRRGRSLVFRELLALPWNISAENGDAQAVTLRVTGTDAMGNVSVLTRAIELDASAISPDLSVEVNGETTSRGRVRRPAFFSPNDDGRQDSVLVSMVNHEAGSLEVRLYPWREPEEGEPDYMVVYQNDAALVGEYQFEWNGAVNGNVVLDGGYYLVPVLTDGCGNKSFDTTLPLPPNDPFASHFDNEVIVQVDTVAPVFTETFPEGGDVLSLEAESKTVLVEASMSTLRPSGLSVPSTSLDERFYVTYRAALGEETPLQMHTAASGVSRAPWNTYGLTGEYEIVWRAEDIAGNRTEKVVPVTVLDKPDLLATFEVDTPNVSPNGDGVIDRLRYRVGVVKPVNAEITVSRKLGGQVAQIYSGALAPGDQALIWDLINNGNTLSDGEYLLKISASSIEFPSLQQEAMQVFTVDTMSPQVVLPALSNQFLVKPYALTVGITDPIIESYSVTLERDGVQSVLAEGSANLVETSLGALAQQADEGDYLLAVDAYDLAGNRSLVKQSFSVDVTPPTLTILTPDVSLLGGDEAKQLSWSVLADDSNPASLIVNLLSEQGEAISLFSGDGETGEISGVLDIAPLNGEFTLTAVMNDAAGNETKVAKVVTIDHQAPVAEIRMPEANGYISGVFAVDGVASDDNIVRWMLSLEGADGSTTQSLVAGKDNVDGVFGSFTPVVADGDYQLQLIVEDAVGYRAEDHVPFTLDTTPPAAPTKLAVELVSAGNYRLSWQASSSQDVAHYLVYDNDLAISGQTVGQTLDFVVQENHDYLFNVVAVDQAGLSSGKSAVLKWALDTEGPTVVLSSPQNEALVSGLVDVVGTASSDDFKEYVVAVASASAPSIWQTLATSPLARLGERLAQWNTLNVQGDGDYILRLQGVDLSGNVSEVSSHVVVDNTAPDAPLSLQADISDNDVTLTWTSSPSLDVAGYLLTRNDNIVNASGVVVGDISPFLINADTYLDSNVVDGDHTYQLYAVDGAGNLSEPAHVTLELDLRAPQLIWVTPQDGDLFEDSLTLQAASDDEDIAVVRYRYRAQGVAEWIDLSPDAANRPYLFGWLTSALAYGDYELQAQVWDDGGLTGSSDIIAVRKTDLTPPASPVNLSAAVNASEVFLDWLPSDSDDVSLYIVNMVDLSSGASIELASVGASISELLVPNLTEGAYAFTVAAKDLAGNVSLNTPVADALVFKPEVDRYAEITLDVNQTFTGATLTGETVHLYKQNENLEQQLVADAPVQIDGSFIFQDVPLVEGENLFTVQVETTDQNTSMPVTLPVVRALMPGKVRELGYQYVQPNSFDEVLLSWLPPDNALAAQYLIKNADGMLLNDTQTLSPFSFTYDGGYPSYGAPENAFDGDSNSEFYPYSYEGWMLEIEFSEPEWFSSIDFEWYPDPVSVAVYGKVAGVWILLGEAEGDDVGRVETGIPQPVTALRLQVLADDERVRLVDASVSGSVPTSETQFSYISSDKADQTFSVMAITDIGIAGEADNIDVQVGDWQAPDAVTLSATVLASEVNLSWTPSVSADVVAYLVYRDGEPVAQVDSPTSSVTDYIDVNVGNGEHSYQVRPLDGEANIGDFSNLISVTITIPLPDAPTYVDSEVDPFTGCIYLSWDAAPSDVAYYIVSRTEDGGLATSIATTTALHYDDCALLPSVSYGYQISAVDVAGNQSVVITVDVGEAADTVAPPAPTILAPVAEGETFDTTERVVTVEGNAEPGVKVELLQNGYLVAETMAVATSGGDGYDVRFDDAYDAFMSPSGAALAVINGDDSVDVLSWPEGEVLYQVPGDQDLWAWAVSWIDDNEFALLRWEYPDRWIIERVSVADASITPISSLSYDSDAEMRTWYFDPSRQKIFVHVSVEDGPGNVLLIDPYSGEQQTLLSMESALLDFALLSPSGTKLAWGNEFASSVLDLTTGDEEQLLCQGDMLGWLKADDAPVLLNSGGFVACDNQGNETVLFEDLDNLIDVFNTPSYILGSQFTFSLSSENPDVSRLMTFDGESIRQVGTFPDDDSYFVGFVEDGRIWYSSWDPVLNSLMVGMTASAINYTFTDARINSGISELAVRAIDAFGNESESSGSIFINASADEFSDLALKLSAPSSVAQGYSLPLSVTIVNNGNVETPATDIRVTVFNAEGVRLPILNESVNVLAPGEAQTFSASWLADGKGLAVLEARVNTSRTISETSYTNNYVSEYLRVTADQAVELSLSGEAILGAPSSLQYANWILVNPSVAEYQGEIVFSVESLGGNELLELARLPVATLPAGATLSGRQAFVLPALQPDEYVLRAHFSTSALPQSVTDTLPLAIAGDVRLAATLATAGQHFGANELVSVGAEISHIGVSGVLMSATINASIGGPEGSVVKSWQQPLAAMLAGDSQRYDFSWNTGVEAPGSYYFDLTVVDDAGATLLNRRYDFIIDGGVPTMQGTLAPVSDVVGYQRPLSLSWQLANTSNINFENVAIAVEARRNGVAAVNLFNTSRSLAVSEIKKELVSLQTAALSIGEWQLVMIATVEVNGVTYQQALDAATLVVRDIDPPSLVIVSPSNLSVLNSRSSLLVIEGSDELSSISAVQWRADDGAWTNLYVSGNGYTQSLTSLTEGSHTLQVRAQDSVGNMSTPSAVVVTVDNTAPLISISGVQSGTFYDNIVEPQINVADNSEFTVSNTLNGLPWAGEPVMFEGSYSLVSEAVDVAGNRTVSSVIFTIDMTAPQISISGVADGGLYNVAVTPDIVVNDAYAPTVAITLDGNSYVGGTPIGAEGLHRLDVVASDIAGNSTQRTVNFTIDTVPPFAPQVTNIQPGAVVDSRNLAVAGDSEPNSVVTLTVAGGVYTTLTDVMGHFLFPAMPFADGENTLSLYAADAAGNISEASSLIFTVRLDNTPPHIDVSGVLDDAYYNEPLMVAVDISDDSNIVRTEILLNGTQYVPGTTINAEGIYLLTVEAEDEFGNSGSLGLSFTIDTTAPQIQIGAVMDGDLRNQPVEPAINISDVSPVTATLLLNGLPYVDGALIDQEGVQVLQVTALDAAGNEGTTEISFELDFTAPDAPMIAAPTMGATVVGPDVLVTGSAEPFSNVSVAVAGQSSIVPVDGAGNFSWLSSFVDGDYELSAVAIDVAGNVSPSSQTSFAVSTTDVVIDPDSTGSRAKVLMWQSESFYSDAHFFHNHSHHNSGSSNCYAEALRRVGIEVTVVENENEFRDALDSENHNVLMFVGPGGIFNLPPLLSADTNMRIRGAIASGYGLIWLNARSALLDSWSDVLGAHTAQGISDVERVEYRVDSNTSYSFSYEGRIAEVHLNGATATADAYFGCDANFSAWLYCHGLSANQPEGPVVAANQYGRGKTRLVALDLEAIENEQVADDILLDLIDDVTPADMEPIAGVPVRQDVVVRRDAIGSQLEATVAIGNGGLMLAGEEAEQISPNSVRWVLADTLEEILTYRLVAAEQGSYAITVSVSDANSGDVIEQRDLSFVMPKSAEMLVNEMRNNLQTSIDQRPWMLTLWASKEFLNDSIVAFESGNYSVAYNKLYWAMLKLQLTTGYDRNVMALMGDYQRILVARQ